MSIEANFRCAAAAWDRGDTLIGTATHVRGFLLIEHPGPWGRSVLREAALPANLLAAMRRRAELVGVRILFMRRHGQRGQDGVRVFAVSPDPVSARIETTVLATHHDVLDLEIEGLGTHGTAGLPVHEHPVVGVCTHGRHDACCAERGRPVAAALTAAYPELTWELSHLGGDRFAANVLLLPTGVGYGRVSPEQAPRLVAQLAAGRLTPELLRGRAGYPMPVQVADFAVRRHLNEWQLDAVRLLDQRRTGQVVTARFECAGATYMVDVEIDTAPAPARLTCTALGESPIPQLRPGAVRVDPVSG